ncbi:unnamed protein product, partial [Durusdinium trenchii]
MKMCTMVNGHLSIPTEIRQRWLSDPMRNPDWRVRLSNFDSVFAPSSAPTNQTPPTPAPNAENVDLAVPSAPPAQVTREAPTGLTLEAFKAQYPTLTTTVTMNLQQQLTCFVVDSKCFITSTTKFVIPPITSPHARPAFLYA